jgi:hypothetical protein
MCATERHGEQIERLTLTGLVDLAKVRDVVRTLMADCAQEDVIDAVLVADELGTLACEYGHLPAGISLIRSYWRPSLRMAVTVRHLALPIAPSRSRTSRYVLEACATDWGIGNSGDRMTLWACICVPAGAAPPPTEIFPQPRVPVH